MSLIVDEFYRVVKVFRAKRKTPGGATLPVLSRGFPARGVLPKGQLRASTSEFFEIGSSR
jgi:hypothetical protein